MPNSNQPDPALDAAARSRAVQEDVLAVSAARRHPATEMREYVRFTRHERTLHVCLNLSFLTLAITGLTLKFSYTSWASKLSFLLGGFQTCGYIHRTAAVVMFCTFGSHLYGLYQLKKTKYGTWKSLIFGENSMIPGPADLKEFIATMRWFVGAGKRPQYGRWTYWEKFDYFAVFWGVAVIGGTGLSLWFPVLFTRFLPGWFINVATIVHSDEALLATGFIFTVHFFNTHLRPEKFPMDTTVFTGRMKLAELKRDKPREFEELIATGKLEQNLAEPYQPIVLRAFRFYAWCTLALGSGIVIWIIYAMIFAYR